MISNRAKATNPSASGVSISRHEEAWAGDWAVRVVSTGGERVASFEEGVAYAGVAAL
jgi:3'-phosphoadenosine 5'-phosphosulfate sulfotransferase